MVLNPAMVTVVCLLVGWSYEKKKANKTTINITNVTAVFYVYIHIYRVITIKIINVDTTLFRLV